MIRKWHIEDKELNQKCIDDVIARVREIEDPEQTGIIAAQDLIDTVLEHMGPAIYNKAIDDVIKHQHDRLQEIEYSTEDLKQA